MDDDASPKTYEEQDRPSMMNKGQATEPNTLSLARVAQTSQRVKKDALWKPLLRGFRIYLRRTLQTFLDIN